MSTIPKNNDDLSLATAKAATISPIRAALSHGCPRSISESTPLVQIAINWNKETKFKPVMHSSTALRN